MNLTASPFKPGSMSLDLAGQNTSIEGETNETSARAAQDNSVADKGQRSSSTGKDQKSKQFLEQMQQKLEK